MIRIHHSFPAIFLLTWAAICPAQGCRTEEDDRRSVFLPESESYAGQTEFDFTSFYRVNRIVGQGTLGRYQGDGTLFNAQAAIDTGVLSRDGCVGFNITAIVPASFYGFVRLVYLEKGTLAPIALSGGFTAGAVPLVFQGGVIYQGGVPMSLPVQMRVYFNGQILWAEEVLLPILESGYTTQISRRIFVDASKIKFARHLPERGGGACSTPPRPSYSGPPEENCPGLNKLSFQYSTSPALNLLGLGVENISLVGRGRLLSFSAMAPVYLATGCCSEDQSFWNKTVVSPNTLAQALTDANIPHYRPDPQTQAGRPEFLPLNGTIKQGAEELAKRLLTTTKIFGFKWLHLVGHSKGGLNSRYILGKRLMEENGVGIRSLVTMNTPHKGAVGADLIAAVLDPDDPALYDLNGGLLDLVVENRVQEESKSNTQFDLSTASLHAFNVNLDFRDPPVTTQVGLTTKIVEVRTTVSDTNLDASQENLDIVNAAGKVISYNERNIGIAEAKGFVEFSPVVDLPLVASIADDLYNFIGTTSGVTLSRYWTFSIPHVIPVAQHGPFKFNDSTVALDSQSYDKRPSFPALEPAISPDAILPGVNRGLAGGHHNGTATAVTAERILEFYRALPR